jgi:hypothetical protein
MAATDRFRRVPDLEIDPLAVSARESQRIARKLREQGRVPRPPPEPEERPRPSLSRGWDRKAEKPIR